MRAPRSPCIVLSLRDGLCGGGGGGAQIETSQERLLLVAETTSGDSLYWWPAPAGHTDAPGATEQRQLPALIPPCPAWSALPQIPKSPGNKRQVAGCPSRQQSCSVFCCERFVSLLFSADCMSLLKTASSADNPGTADASLQVSLPLLFSSCLSPFLSFLLLLRFVRKDWPFIDIPCQAQYFFLSLLADPSLTVGQG